MNKYIIPKTLSPIISLVVLFSVFGWLFAKVKIPEDSPREISITIKKPEPAVKVKRDQYASQPAVKRARKETDKKSSIKGMAGISKAQIPVIHIYYAPESVYKYMRTLASRNCLFLIRSSAGSLLATYDPDLNTVTGDTPRDFSGYSPRSRILALYSENPLTDRIIEKAVEISPKMLNPNGCSLIAVLSLRWENALLNAIARAANSAGIDSKDVSSAEAHFSGTRLILTSIKSSTQVHKNINLPVYF